MALKAQQAQNTDQVPENENFIEQLMKTAPEQFKHILKNKKKFETQIIYTQINRDKDNKPSFKSFSYNVDEERYFYPASTVKMPAAFLALERLNELNTPGLTANTNMLTDSAYTGQSAVYKDETVESGIPSVAQYAKKIFIVSDNDAFNRLFELLGHDYINNNLAEKGYDKTRIRHRLALYMPGDGGQYTNPIRFEKDGELLYEKPLLSSSKPYHPDEKILKGKGYINGSGELVKKKFEFTYKNFMPLTEMQEMLKAVVFPEAVDQRAAFDLSPLDYEMLYRFMSQLPGESDYPKYDKEEFNDSYSKFLLFGAKDAIPDHIRIFNKIGLAYGYMTDNAYIIDTKNNVEFLLSAVIHVNENEIYNDGVYEYDSLGLPFMKNIGKLIYDYELNRAKERKPDLSKFELSYDTVKKVSADFAPNLSANYHQYHEPALDYQRIKYQNMQPLIDTLKRINLFNVEQIGQSVEGRPINLVTVGTGPVKVLLWSQMHGDESTATRALFEIFDFLAADDALNEFREKLLSELTIYVIPMLNPDGAEVFNRRNALSIDLNRDALRLTSPEARILKSIRDKYEPEFGFNLHDQSKYYNVANSGKTASISFLAPAYNYEKEINEGRGNAMKLIGKMNQMLQQYIPGGVGRYDDAFEPRAFGDNIQKWGTNTVLIESGGVIGDPEKKYLVKMNFMAILFGLHEIANKGYAEMSLKDYQTIPENDRNFFDLLIRNTTEKRDGKSYTLDIGLFTSEKLVENRMVGRTYIGDLGDLSTYYGYEELDAEGHEVSYGKIYPEAIENISSLALEKAQKWLAEGYTTVRVKQLPTAIESLQLPLKFVAEDYEAPEKLSLGSGDPLLLMKDNVVRFAIINGSILTIK